jgi:hypothetical protein
MNQLRLLNLPAGAFNAFLRPDPARSGKFNLFHIPDADSAFVFFFAGASRSMLSCARAPHAQA